MKLGKLLTAKDVERKLTALGNPTVATHAARYFKTGPGEYGEGDKFLGVRVPVVRQVVREARSLDFSETLTLLKSPLHEVRLFALIWLVERFKRAEATEQTQIYQAYRKHIKYINNWDLVDVSAPKIVGAYLFGRERDELYKLIRSRDLWRRRIAILATFYFISKNEFKDALTLAEIVLDDSEDLIHKASGWMLREIGKRNLKVAQNFLDQHCRTMPRTMLRYAIERFTPSKRQAYLKGAPISAR